MNQELIERLEKLSPAEGDVFIIEVRADYFEDEERKAEAIEFAHQVLDATGRDVFVVREGYRLFAVPDPRTPESPESPEPIVTGQVLTPT
jgi:hypothetical protein